MDTASSFTQTAVRPLIYFLFVTILSVKASDWHNEQGVHVTCESGRASKETQSKYMQELETGADWKTETRGHVQKCRQSLEGEQHHTENHNKLAKDSGEGAAMYWLTGISEAGVS